MLGPAHGVNTLATFPLGEALARLARGVYSFRYWNATNSLIYTVLPGVLARVWPSPYWAHVLTLLLVVATFAAVWRVSELTLRHAWFLGLAWCASPALLSFAIAGYPYATGFLPHALALLIVTSRWLRERPLAALLAALAASELSWQLYEAGKTLTVLFIVGAIVERAAPAATRLAWLAASVLQAARLLLQRGYNVDYVASGTAAGWPSLLAAARRTAQALARPEVDLPLLVPLAILALPFTRRHRWLLAAGLFSQLATLVLAGAVEPEALRPRRWLTTTFYAIAILAVAFKDSFAGGGRARALVRRTVVAALAAGGAWQAADAWLFFTVPPAGRTHPLPFTFSKDDYFVAAPVSDLAAEVESEVAAGRHVVLLYNLSSETPADPAALVERVYLTLGHERFLASVLSFGVRRCRLDCQPILPLEGIPAALTSLADSREPAVAFYKKALDPRRHVEESALVLDALAERFSIRPETDPAPGFGRLALQPRPQSIAAAATFERTSEPLPLDLAWLPNPRVPEERVRTSPAGDQAFRYVWSATAVAASPSSEDVLLGADGRLSVWVDGQRLLERSGAGFTLWRERLPLPPGRSHLEVRYQARSGAGRLVVRPQAAQAP